MSDHIALLAANILAPVRGQVAVFTTSTTAIVTTLSHSSHLGLLAKSGGFLTMVADGGDVYFCFSGTGVDSAASNTVGPAVTDGERGWLLKDGQPQSFRLVKDSSGNAMARLHHACTGAAKKLRVYLSSGHTTEQKSKV